MFIDGNLTQDSLMVDMLVDGGVRFELGCGSSELYKYLIHNRSGGKMTLKWDGFKNLSVKNLLRIKNVHDDYIITIKNIIN